MECRCTFCGANKHRTKNCPQKHPCKICKSTSHLTCNCPQRRATISKSRATSNQGNANPCSPSVSSTTSPITPCHTELHFASHDSTKHATAEASASYLSSCTSAPTREQIDERATVHVSGAVSHATAEPLAQPTLASPSTPLRPPVFEPSEEWREVQPGQPCPGGSDYRCDMNTGRNFARLPSTSIGRMATREQMDARATVHVSEAVSHATAEPHAQPALAYPSAPLRPPVFEPSEEWREIQPGQPCPGGQEYHCDMNTGRNFARLPSTSIGRMAVAAPTQ